LTDDEITERRERKWRVGVTAVIDFDRDRVTVARQCRAAMPHLAARSDAPLRHGIAAFDWVLREALGRSTER